MANIKERGCGIDQKSLLFYIQRVCIIIAVGMGRNALAVYLRTCVNSLVVIGQSQSILSFSVKPFGVKQDICYCSNNLYFGEYSTR